MELFTKSQILTKRYIRYAGDHYCTIALVKTYDGQTMLYCRADEPLLKHITTDPKYSDWLFKNHFDLLELAWAPGNVADMEWFSELRYTEFRSILESLS